jgi:hypothetical protein
MAQIKNKLPLSKKAQSLLDDILQEEKSKEAAHEAKSTLKASKEEETSVSPDFVTTKNHTFRINTYEYLASGPKAIMWFAIAFILIILSLMLILKGGAHSTSQNRSASEALTFKELKEENAKLQTRLTDMAKANKESHEQFNALSTKYPNKLKAQGFLDETIRLFEQSGLMIIKQEIKFQEKPSNVNSENIDIEKPALEKNVFIKDEASGTDKKNDGKGTSIIDQIKNKPIINNLMKKVPGNLNMTNNISSAFQNTRNNGSKLNYLSFTLIIKGKYASYQLARNTLTRLIPSVSIPLEQIVIQPQQSDVEMKVVFDIPFINQ